MSSDGSGFVAVDYVIFGLMLAISAGIGIFFGIKNRGKKQTSKGLILGNKEMGVYLL